MSRGWIIGILLGILAIHATPAQALKVVDLTAIPYQAKEKPRDTRTNGERLVDLANKRLRRALAKMKKKYKVKGSSTTPPFNFSINLNKLDLSIQKVVWSF